MSALEYGIFARVFPIGSATEIATAIADSGYTLAQLNLSALGLQTIPNCRTWNGLDTDPIRVAFDRAGIRLWGLSCSYNMAHPDAVLRREGTMAAIELIARAPAFGVTAVTLCTGSRNPEKMWSAHPANSGPEAWTDLRTELDLLLAAASDAGVVLGIEPEPGNIVRDADTAARLLSQLGDDARLIGIIADPANLLATQPAERHQEILERSFETLHANIVCLHAKDLVPWSETLAGRGIVDYDLVAKLYEHLPRRPPIIVQDSRAEDARRALDFLRARIGDRPIIRTDDTRKSVVTPR